MSVTTSANLQCKHSHLADHNNVNDNDPDHVLLSSSQLASEQSSQQSNQLVLQELKKISQTLQKMQGMLTSTEENVKNMQIEVSVLNKKKTYTKSMKPIQEVRVNARIIAI